MTTKEIQFSSDDQIALVAGEQSKNLRVIEKELEVKIASNKNGLNVTGEDSAVDFAINLIEQLKGILVKNSFFDEQDVKRAISILSSDQSCNLKQILTTQIKVGSKTKPLFPKTLNQKKYLDLIRNKDLVFGIGPAGTGKTYLAMAMGIYFLLNKEVKKIILSRPAVEAGEKLGFLPGDLVEKVNPYLRPLYDALYDFMEFDKVQELIEKEIIEIAPLAFMRGRTLSNAFIILDEAQNTSAGQMKMILTRIGKGSKCLITGDITQVDLPKGVKSGLVEALSVLKDIQDIGMLYFTEEDVVRHALVAKIITAYKNS